MYLITKNAVDYNLPLSGTANGKVKARIRMVKERKAPYMTVNFDYLKEDEGIIESSAREFTEAEANGIFDVIKAGMPDVLTTPWSEWRAKQLYYAFRHIMAEKLSITVNDIDLIEE
jgi:hypothetical protein